MAEPRAQNALEHLQVFVFCFFFSICSFEIILFNVICHSFKIETELYDSSICSFLFNKF